MTEQEAKRFANDWILAWNSHNLDSILEHYSDDVEFTSPFVVELLNKVSGTIHQKHDLRSYFRKGLEAYPELHFELLNVLIGVSSITLYYRSVKNLLAAEVMYFDDTGKVTKVLAHYSN